MSNHSCSIFDGQHAGSFPSACIELRPMYLADMLARLSIGLITSGVAEVVSGLRVYHLTQGIKTSLHSLIPRLQAPHPITIPCLDREGTQQPYPSKSNTAYNQWVSAQTKHLWP